MRRALIAIALTATAPVTLAADYMLDPAHTYPHFSIRHFGMSNMLGRFDKTEGTLSIDQEAGTGAVEVTIDAASINTGHEKRDEHLRSPDFLNVVEFPEITFKSTNVTFNGQDKATVEGDLTILGVTKPVTLDATSVVCGTHPMRGDPRCGIDATATIKRSDFGMTYGLPDAIGDEMQLIFEVEAQPPE